MQVIVIINAAMMMMRIPMIIGTIIAAKLLEKAPLGSMDNGAIKFCKLYACIINL